MRETDITQFNLKIREQKETITGKEKVKSFFKFIWKLFLTVFLILFCAGAIVGTALGIYMYGLSEEKTGIDLRARSLNLSSFIYVQEPETDVFVEYQTLYATENRVWVKYADIPEAMMSAVIAIEDKRFMEHPGVDWYRTAGAILGLVTGRDNHGGSTLTQQLIKNVTDDDEVSLTRKLREIFRALNLEKDYTKQEILEGYLNVVNFGNNCQGVQSAAQLYFNKDIGECSIAECAAIAGITQNPSKWNPLIYPENNKIRRDDIIEEMYSQGKINEKEYKAAVKESDEMTFETSKYIEEDDDDDTPIQNWYIDAMQYQLVQDLMKELNITSEVAEDKLFSEGLSIYCAMDLEMQEYMEEVAMNIDKDSDSDLQIGMTMIEHSTGRVIGTVGSSEKKEYNLDFSRATDAKLSPGSSIKPIIPYPLAIEQGYINYSSMVEDKYIDPYYNDGKPGPNNFDDSLHGNMLVTDAIEWSLNTVPARLIYYDLGPKAAYDQAVGKMGFSLLDEKQDSVNAGALSIGSMQGGVTTWEMATAYEYIGNGGRIYPAFTYYYVKDYNGKKILDNSDNISKQAYTPETATIINRLLNYNINNSSHTSAGSANISGWDIIGKTGSTDDYKDIWFCGVSPYTSLAVWTGYDTPATVNNRLQSIYSFKSVMSKYLEGKKHKEYKLSDNVIKKSYCANSGNLASSGCKVGGEGYYTEDNMPEMCNETHATKPPTTKVKTTAAPTANNEQPPETDPPEEATNPPTQAPATAPPAETQADETIAVNEDV